MNQRRDRAVRTSLWRLQLNATTGMTVHGRPRFARCSFRDGIEEQIAPVHPDFVCGLVPLSLMGLAGRLPIALPHSRCCSHFGFGQPRSDLFAIIA